MVGKKFDEMNILRLVNNMEKKVEYAIAAAVNGKVFPKVFMSEEEVKLFIKIRPDPSHWKIVRREVVYGEWE